MAVQAVADFVHDLAVVVEHDKLIKQQLKNQNKWENYKQEIPIFITFLLNLCQLQGLSLRLLDKMHFYKISSKYGKRLYDTDAVMQEAEKSLHLTKEDLFQKCCEFIKNQIKESKIIISTYSQDQSEESTQMHNYLIAHLNEVLQQSTIPQPQVAFVIILFGGFDQLPQIHLDLHILKTILQTYSNLKTVVLNNCNIGDAGMKVLKECKLDCLQFLQLTINHISKKGIKIMAGCTFRSLEDLNLSFNNIGNEGILYLSKANWPALRIFHVVECNATTDALRIIQKANWPKLQTVSINGENEDLFYAASLKFFSKQYFPRPLIRNDTYPNHWRWNKAFANFSLRIVAVFSKRA